MEKRIAFLFSVCFILICGSLWAAGADDITGEVISGRATEGSANVSLDYYELVNFTILFPEATNYSFAIGQPIVLDLNVSWSNRSTPSNWKFTLVDMWLNATINQSAPFSPNTTIYPNRRSHNLTVTVENEAGAISIRSVVFYIDNTAPIIDLNDNEALACEDTIFSYLFNVTDAEDGGITLGVDPAGTFFLGPDHFTGYAQEVEIGSFDLNQEYLGLHELILSATDGEASDVRYFNVTVIETNKDPGVWPIGVSTLWVKGDNTTYSKEVTVYDTECGCYQDSGNFTFNLTYTGGGNPFFNISRFGKMSFVANYSLLGPDNESVVYNMTLCVTDQALSNPHQNISYCGDDGLNNTVCRNFSITVTDKNRAPYFDSYYPGFSLEAPGTTQLYFNASERDPD
ncbi:MAG: hypothetical protein KKD18_00790, partial [Nanoarchaeota archaeon]|nr:hypothetical protein [Nanoarchaeota archaeon]